MTFTTPLPVLVGRLIREADQERPRYQQTAVGISELGGCMRQAAYKVSGAEPTDEDTSNHAPAMIGTWLHEALLPRLAAASTDPGARIEVPVQVTSGPLPLPGTIDLLTAKNALDVKTVSGWGWQRVLTEGPKRQHRWQLHTYGQAYVEETGDPLDDVTLLFFARDSGEVMAHTEPWSPVVAAEALTWWAAAVEYGQTAPDAAPREDRRGPGHDIVCSGCPFRTRCWGPASEWPVQTQLAAGPGLETMLGVLHAATRAKSQAEKDQAFAKDALAATDPGIYGRYRLRRGRGSAPMVVDADAAEDVLDRVAKAGVLVCSGCRHVALGFYSPMDTCRECSEGVMVEPQLPRKAQPRKGATTVELVG